MAKAKKLPSGNWRVQAKITIDGKQICKSFTANDKKTAELKAIQWQSGLTEDTENITLKKAYERYIQSKSDILSVTTIRGYKRMAKNHLQEIMPLNIGDLTDEKIQRAINIVSGSSSPKTVRNNYGLLTAVLTMFRPQYHPNIKLPQKKKTELYIPTKDEVKAALKAAENTNCYIPILLAATCGMRAGEICALTDEDITDNKISVSKSMACDSDGKWHTKAPKTFSGNRNIDMPPIVAKAVNGKSGKIVVYNPHSLSIAFHKLLIKNNFTLYRFHDLRHYYVSELFDMGLPEKYIIAQVGHSSSNITKAVYDHLTASKQSQYATDIANHFSDF